MLQQVGVVELPVTTWTCRQKMAELATCASGSTSSPPQDQLDEMELLQAMSNADEFNWTQDPETGDYCVRQEPSYSLWARGIHVHGFSTALWLVVVCSYYCYVLQVGCLEPWVLAFNWRIPFTWELRKWNPKQILKVHMKIYHVKLLKFCMWSNSVPYSLKLIKQASVYGYWLVSWASPSYSRREKGSGK